MAETVAERVRRLREKAAQVAVDEGRAKPTDELLLNPDKYTKTEASQIRSYEKSKEQGGDSYLDTETLGQQRQNEQTKKVYGETGYDPQYGGTYTGGQSAINTFGTPFSSQRPSKGEDESSDAYRLRLLTWERDDARQAFQATVEATKGARGAAEAQGATLDELFQKEKAQRLRNRTKVNPEYTKLSAEEKKRNAQEFEKTGKYIVDPTISADTGRAPIRTTPLSESERRNQASFNQKIAEMDKAIAEGRTDDIPRFERDEMPFLEEYLDFQSFQANADQDALKREDAVNELGDSVKRLRLELGLTEDQELDFDENGDPVIREDGEIFDPVERAKKKAEDKKESDLAELKENNDLKIARIENANRVNGKVTEQGRRQVATETRKYLKDKAEIEEAHDENIENEIQREQKNQFNVEARVEALMSPENLAKEAKQRAIMADAKALFKTGAVSNWTAAIQLANSKRDQDAKEPTKAQQYKKVDDVIFQQGFDRSKAFDSAATVFGHDVAGIGSYLKSRGFTDKDIADQRKSYQKDVLGYTQEQIDADGAEMKVSDIYEKDPKDLSEAELDFLQEYEIENPKKAMRWKFKIQNPEMTDAEIWVKVEEAFKSPEKKKAAAAAKTPTIASRKNKFFDTEYKKAIEEGKTEGEALRAAQNATDAAFSKESSATSKNKKGSLAGGGEGDDVEVTDFDLAEDSLGRALEDKLIEATEIDSYLESNYPDLSEADKKALKKSFKVTYDPSSRTYSATVPENFSALQDIEADNMMIHADGTRIADLTPIEKIKFMKMQGELVKSGNFEPEMSIAPFAADREPAERPTPPASPEKLNFDIDNPYAVPGKVTAQKKATTPAAAPEDDEEDDFLKMFNEAKQGRR